MHYADIISALIKAGHPPSKLADSLEVGAPSISRVIRGDMTSKRIAKRISRITRIPTNKLWPDGRYERRNKQARRLAA
jgi:lambda repressor-like predicted transcriptional regulator